MRLHHCEAGSPADRAEGGFTLLEVLVAFIIAALVLGVVVDTSATAVRATHEAGRIDEAVARAASHIAIVSAAPLVESDRQGDEGGGFHWHVRIASAATARTPVDQSGQSSYALTLYRITVTVTWMEDGHSRAVHLESAQLGPLT